MASPLASAGWRRTGWRAYIVTVPLASGSGLKRIERDFLGRGNERACSLRLSTFCDWNGNTTAYGLRRADRKRCDCCIASI
jgi:hypothetical protein